MVDNWGNLYSALSIIHFKYGLKIISEPMKIKNLLADLSPESQKENKALFNVLCDKDIERYITNNPYVDRECLVSRIENNFGLSVEWSQKIAVGIIALMGEVYTEKKALLFEDSVDKAEIKLLPTTTHTVASDNSKIMKQKTPSYEQQLIGSGYNHLINGQWDKAMKKFESVIENSTNPRAYVGKMMVTLGIKKENEIPYYKGEFQSNPYWKKVINNATGSYKDKLQRYEREHKTILDRKKQITRIDGKNTLSDYLSETSNGYLSWSEAKKIFAPFIEYLISINANVNNYKYIQVNPDNLCFEDNRLYICNFIDVQSMIQGNSYYVVDGYSAIEVYKSGVRDESSLVYSVAMCLYKSLTGIIPPSALEREENDKLIIPYDIANNLPMEVIKALSSALQIYPNRRTKTLDEIYNSLKVVQTNVPRKASDVGEKSKDNKKKFSLKNIFFKH